jgi:hypothetical protein
MITPSDDASAPAQYDAVPVQEFNIQAEQPSLAREFGAANAVAGAGVLYPAGPRQAQTETLLSSPQGFATEGYDIDAGFSGRWPNDVEPTVAGP